MDLVPIRAEEGFLEEDSGRLHRTEGPELSHGNQLGCGRPDVAPHDLPIVLKMRWIDVEVLKRRLSV